ncbi:hypothetical protein PHMEG_00038624, partial [Phytophthora megakarya]
VFLSESSLISVVETHHSAQVVIEKGTIITDNKGSDLVVEASGSSAVYVSDASAELNVADLVMEASGNANIYLQVASVTTKEVTLESRDSAAISVLTSSLEMAGDAVLETQGSGTICTSAKQVTVGGDYVGESASGISMPNASDKHDATGTLACDKFTTPARKPSSTVKTNSITQPTDKASSPLLHESHRQR